MNTEWIKYYLNKVSTIFCAVFYIVKAQFKKSKKNYFIYLWIIQIL